MGKKVWKGRTDGGYFHTSSQGFRPDQHKQLELVVLHVKVLKVGSTKVGKKVDSSKVGKKFGFWKV